jgi:hypothetical protein
VTAESRDGLVAAMRAAANRAIPKVAPAVEDDVKAHMRRLAQVDACIFHAAGQAKAWQDLSDDELGRLVDVLDRVADGHLDLFLRTSGTYQVRRAATKTKGRVA